MKLGGGDLTRHTEVVENARFHFLEAFVLECPKAVPALLATTTFEGQEVTEERWATEAPRWKGQPSEALQRWAEHYHLTDPWCIDFAIYTLREGRAAYEPLKVETSVALGQNAHPDPEHGFSFTLRAPGFGPTLPESGWNPAREARGEAKKRITLALGQKLDEYLDEMEQRARMRGLVASIRKQDGDRHFRWFVRYQCREESYSSIAKSEHADRRTVSEAVKDLAELIGLTLRPATKPGRPRREADT
ncbi:MAG TPA: hypothetical protein VFE20_01030 [Thermoleophilia bacterium]|nr:hypothetical protein [Thermoleophilia bacterium]